MGHCAASSIYVRTYNSVVMLKDRKWCWKDPEISTVIVKGSQDHLKFTHTGYKMSYEVSHDTLIVSHGTESVNIPPPSKKYATSLSEITPLEEAMDALVPHEHVQIWTSLSISTFALMKKGFAILVTSK